MMTPELKLKGLSFNVMCFIRGSSYRSKLTADAGKVKRILINLLGNAIKFTHQGSIGVTVDFKYTGEKEVELHIEITDTGIGIPEDKFEVIFDQFVKLNPSNQGIYGGTGLGLNIVKEFLKVMRGGYEVKSQLGKGSVFKVWMPCKVS
jgi:two-component system, sensor histidine kinase